VRQNTLDTILLLMKHLFISQSHHIIHHESCGNKFC